MPSQALAEIDDCIALITQSKFGKTAPIKTLFYRRFARIVDSQRGEIYNIVIAARIVIGKIGPGLIPQHTPRFLLIRDSWVYGVSLIISRCRASIILQADQT